MNPELLGPPQPGHKKLNKKIIGILLKAQAPEDICEHAAMSHDRLSDLGILSIERDRFSEVDKRKVLEMFAQRKARGVRILQL